MIMMGQVGYDYDYWYCTCNLPDPSTCSRHLRPRVLHPRICVDARLTLDGWVAAAAGAVARALSGA